MQTLTLRSGDYHYSLSLSLCLYISNNVNNCNPNPLTYSHCRNFAHIPKTSPSILGNILSATQVLCIVCPGILFLPTLPKVTLAAHKKIREPSLTLLLLSCTFPREHLLS